MPASRTEKPVGHARHLVESGAGWYIAEGQTRHEVEPEEFWYFPGLQATQASAPMASTIELDFPTGQYLHPEDPTTSLYWPAAHGRQATAATCG